MRTLGVLGGMSWESTVTYYQLLNRGVRERLGGLHSAPLLLHSVDFAQIAAQQKAGEWAAAGQVLAEAARGLEGAGATALLLATNTMHKVATAIEEAVDIPLLHIGDAVGRALQERGVERVALLRDLPINVVDEIIEKRITLTPGGQALVRTMRANGAYTCLVSGGFTLFTGPVAAEVGFNEHRSNHLILNGDKLAGQVEEPILGREAKLATLVELRARFGLAPHETMAVGDGANDLAMLEEAGLGIAFHAKPAVAAAAHARIDHADLSALLYVQGYRVDEFLDT